MFGGSDDELSDLEEAEDLPVLLSFEKSSRPVRKEQQPPRVNSRKPVGKEQALENLTTKKFVGLESTLPPELLLHNFLSGLRRDQFGGRRG